MSVSLDTEAVVIEKLKDACGHDYTSKLSRMFQDCIKSKNLMDDYVRVINIVFYLKNIIIFTFVYFSGHQKGNAVTATTPPMNSWSSKPVPGLLSLLKKTRISDK